LALTPDRLRRRRAGSGAYRGLQSRGTVGALPRQIDVGAAEVPVRRRLGVDRAQQVEVADDRGRTQVEDLGDRGLDLHRVDVLGAERLDEQADRGRLADGVRHLHLDALGEACGHRVLGHPAHRVGGGAVDLGRVLAGERAAAVAGEPAIGVDDDLAAGEARVSHRAAHDEPAGGVDQQAHVGDVDAEVADLRADDVLADVGREHGVQVDVGGVLGGDDHCVEPHGLVAVVLDGDLGLAVRTQVGQQAGLAGVGEPARQPVGERDGQRQQLGGVGVRVAEHQALVTGALAGDLVLGGLHAALVRGVDALGDVGGLRADRDVHAARGAVEALGRGVVADLEHLVPHERGDVGVGTRRDLARHVHLTGGDERLHRHPAARVLRQQRVEDGVADGVAHLVRVTFGHRLAGEQPPPHVRHAVLHPLSRPGPHAPDVRQASVVDRPTGARSARSSAGPVARRARNVTSHPMRPRPVSPFGGVALCSEPVTETLVDPLRRPTFHGGTLNMKTPTSLFDRPGRAAAVVGAVVAVSATATVALVAGTATATPTDDESGRCTKNVNVRAEPDVTSRIVALCEQGTEVQVGESRHGFLQLTNLGGWAAQEYVSVNGHAPAPAERAGTTEGDDDGHDGHDDGDGRDDGHDGGHDDGESGSMIG
jgi:hypothetical protein